MAQHLIGVISDTHGLLRAEAVAALQGVELIVHAGDIGKPEILTELAEIAPVEAVRGNNDRTEWAAALPETLSIEVGTARLYILHNLKELALDPAQAGYSVVIAGHSHKPLNERRGETLYLNPGSAGPRRFKLPITVALLTVGSAGATARIIELL